VPLYEFYCPDCHMIFNFLSRRVNTDKQPDCPRCGRAALERQVSRFAVTSGRTEDAGEVMPDLDGESMERAMETLSGEMAGLDENDPRQMARFMRKLGEATGMDLGAEVGEAIRRLESGEDPEKIEEDMGGVLDGENQLVRGRVRSLKRKMLPPEQDEKLYLL
jgi:putative FmdB family regulatory protein